MPDRYRVPQAADTIFTQSYAAQVYRRGVVLDMTGYTGRIPDPEPGASDARVSIGLSWPHLKGLAQFFVSMIETHEAEHGIIPLQESGPSTNTSSAAVH